MIWLLVNAWWLVPAVLGLGVAAAVFLGPGWPVVAAALRRVPAPVWAVLAGLLLIAFAFQGGRWYERSRLEKAQETAEARADAKADRVTKAAGVKAQEAKTAIRTETEGAANEAREIVRYLPATCPAQPDRLRDLGEQAVAGARGEVLPAPGR